MKSKGNARKRAARMRARVSAGMARINMRFFKRLPAHEKRVTLATMVTFVRIGLIPFIISAMRFDLWGIALFLFVIAALSDAFDGILARTLNQRTFLGACLDPVADKLLILSCFSALLFVRSSFFSIPLWFVLTVLCKELAQIICFVCLYVKKGHIRVQPTLLGKFTTLIQMSFITWLFACYYFHWLPVKTYYTMLCLMLGLVVASSLQYARMGVRFLQV